MLNSGAYLRSVNEKKLIVSHEQSLSRFARRNSLNRMSLIRKLFRTERSFHGKPMA